MTRSKKFAVCLLLFVLAVLICFGLACGKSNECTEHVDSDFDGICDVCGTKIGDDDDEDDDKTVTEDKTVESISVKTLPTKTAYFLDEEFTLEGGEITVHYTDGSEDVLSMTDERLEVTEPKTSRIGSKTVTIEYGGEKTDFKITVSEQGLSVVFDMNYDGGSDVTVNVAKGRKVARPSDPVRDGFEFYDWYVDDNCTVLYDFSQSIVADTTIYAMWLEDGVDYHDVSYDLNYYGCAQDSYTFKVRDGGTVSALPVAVEREDYEFVGWMTDESGTQSFDFDTPVSSDVVLYAKWNKTKTGSSVYTFEAEDTDLSQKAGPGYSGENAGVGMIVTNDKVDANQDKFVAYQCKYGNSLEFYVASDEATDDAELTVRFAAEFSSMTLDPSVYQISVNGVAMDYDAIVLDLPAGENQSTFADFVIGGIELKEGANLIQLKTINNNPLGGTLTATAPIIDCIKISTSAVVIWDGNYGLPMDNY